MIKKFVIKDIERGGGTYTAIGSFRMYDEEDVMFEITNPKGSGTAQATFDQATVNSSINSTNTGHVYKAFDTGATSSNSYFNYGSSSVANAVITFEFKDGFEPEFMSKFTFIHNPSSSYRALGFTITFYDELDNELVTYMPTGLPDSGNGTVTTIQTPELMPNYVTNDPQRVATLDSSRLSNIFNLTLMEVTHIEPPLTAIRYAFSFDGRVTWKVYKTGSWQQLGDDTAATLNRDGMTKDDVEALSLSEWMQEHVAGGNIDVAASLNTADTQATPVLQRISVTHINTTRMQTKLLF